MNSGCKPETTMAVCLALVDAAKTRLNEIYPGLGSYFLQETEKSNAHYVRWATFNTRAVIDVTERPSSSIMYILDWSETESSVFWRDLYYFVFTPYSPPLKDDVIYKRRIDALLKCYPEVKRSIKECHTRFENTPNEQVLI